jgi:hypothetical protein
MTSEIDPENADLFDGRENGSLHIFLGRIADPASDGAVDMRLDFHHDDWAALFVGVLDVPTSDWLHLSREAQRIEFRKALPEYPMLAEIWDIYADAAFLPEEVPQLRSECLRVKSETTQPEALKALRKLVYACDEAAKRGFCLLLSSD